MNVNTRMAQLVAVLWTAMFICAVPAIAQDCPELVGWWQEGSATTVAASGLYAYIGDQVGSFRVIDTSDPAAPNTMGIIGLPGDVEDIEVSGEFAYVIAAGWLWVIDVSEPSDPVWVGFASIPGAVAIAVEGDYAYVVHRDAGHLLVLDVGIPESPTQVGQLVLNPVGYSVDIEVAGDYAYVPFHEIEYHTFYGSYVYAVDVTDPSLPVRVGEFIASPCHLHDLALDSGGIAYDTASCLPGSVPPPWFFLGIIDVSNPHQPQSLGGMSFDWGVGSIAASRGYAYVGAGNDRLIAINARNPTQPHETGFYDTPGTVDDVAVAGGYVYVTVGDAGLMIFRDCAAVFSNGFESGDTSAWSTTVP